MNSTNPSFSIPHQASQVMEKDNKHPRSPNSSSEGTIKSGHAQKRRKEIHDKISAICLEIYYKHALPYLEN